MRKGLFCLTTAITGITLVGTSECHMVLAAENSEVDYDLLYDNVLYHTVTDVLKKGGDIEWLDYALYDFNHDGYLDLFIQNGTCDADMLYEVYSTDGTSNFFWGSIGGDVALFEYPEGAGFYTEHGQMGHEVVNLVTAEGGTLTENCIFDSERDGAMQEGILGKLIETRSLGSGFTWNTETSDYVFPDSDKRYLTEEEVRSADRDMLAFGRNEIFARHGYIFKESPFPEYFAGKSWYQGTVTGDQFDSAVFNDYELKNIDLILSVEQGSEESQVSVDYSGGYIDGTDDDSSYIEMTQSGNKVSYVLSSAGETIFAEDQLTINPDGTVTGELWTFQLSSDGTLTLSMADGSGSFQLWKVSGNGAVYP